MKSGSLGEFIAAIKDGKVPKGDSLVVENIDRLSRLDYLDAQQVITDIIRAGISIHVCGLPYELSRQSLRENDGLVYMLVGEIQRARRESERKSQFTKRFWSRAYDLAMEGRRCKHKCPRWLTWDEGNNCYILIPERARTVKLIYDLCAKKKMGSAKIRSYLIDSKVPSFGRGQDNFDGWTEVYIQKILAARTVLGEMQLYRTIIDSEGRRKSEPHGNPIKDYYPSIVPDNIWEQVNAIRSERLVYNQGAKQGTVPNLFSGRIKCASCGHSMVITVSQKKLVDGSKNYFRYFNCGHKCSMIYGWPIADMEQRILRFIGNEIEPELLSGNSEANSALNNLRSTLSDLQVEFNVQSVKRSRIVSRIEDEDAPPSLLKDFYTRIEKLDDQIEKLNGQIAAKTAELKNLSESYDGASANIQLVSKLLERLDDQAARGKIKIAIAAMVRKVRVSSFPGEKWLEVEFRTGLKRRIIDAKFRQVSEGVYEKTPKYAMAFDLREIKSTIKISEEDPTDEPGC